MDKNEISFELFQKIYLEYGLELKVFLRGAKTKADSFDKFRKVGYVKEQKNPIFVKAITKAITPNSLIVRNLGLSESGAIQIIVSEDDVNFLKLSEKIEHNDSFYTPYNKALGNRFQEFPSDYAGFVKIVLFKMNDSYA